MDMSMKLRKFSIFLLKKSYRSVYNHPFLVCMLLFLVFMCRSSPFLFSLLVSASPVLVCTAVLLGILLSFGQPNIPEIEKDEKLVNETGSLITGIIRTDTIVVEKSEESCVERVTHKNLGIAEHLNDDMNLVANTNRELDQNDKLDSSVSITIGSREIQLDKEDVADGKSKVDEDDELEFEMDKSPAESIDSKRVNVDSLDSPPDSPEEEERGGGDDAEEDDDDDSDQAESSSPDASMTDIIPLLDELHPLLDDDAPPHPIPFSHDGSDAASERSDESNDSGSISDDNIEKHEDLEDEEEHYNKESETKTAITWTEEDQKNLMDLGSSELERNQRLESLVARRRRANKCVSMMPERNLIDFDSTNLPFNISPISTSRNYPFDIGHDSYGNNTGLPPFPGSAPSILLPRRNPFDIPYNSSEEKPNLMTDSFQQKETFFRCRESFNVGPSIFGPNRHDKDDNNRFKPFFVPEKSYLEESSFSSPFQRQSSGLSDSKASSVPETDSVVSTDDIEENDNNLVVEDNVTQNTETVNFVPELELTSQTRNLESKNSSGDDICEALEVENSNLGDEDFIQEPEAIVKMEDVSEHVGHGSQSSEEDDSSSENGEVEDRETRNDNGELLVGDVIHKAGQLELHRDTDGMPIPLDFNEETQMQTQHSLHGSDSNKEKGSIGGDPHHNHKEPIYDSSPTSITKNASSSSILSEINAESNMMGFPSILIKGPVSFPDINSESGGPKLEGTTNTSKIDLQLRDEGSNSTMIMPVATEFSDSRVLIGNAIDADLNFQSMNSSSKNTDAVISAGSSFINTDAVISIEQDEKEIHSNVQNST